MILSIIGLLIIYFLLVWKAGKIYPILYLFLFIYFLQYLFSSYLIYNEYPALAAWMPIKIGRAHV